MRSVLAIGVTGVALLATAASPAGGAGSASPCTTAQLEGVRTPLVVAERGGANVKSLRAGVVYRAIVVEELAIGEIGWARDGSFAVTAPSGLALKRVAVDGRAAWEFVAPSTGPVRLQVAWLQESRDDPAQACSASAAVTLAVAAPPALAQVGSGRLTHPTAEASTFVLPVLPAKLADPRPVTVSLRLRTGAAQPAASTGKPIAAWRLLPEDGRFTRAGGRTDAWLRPLSLHYSLETDARGAVLFTVYPDPNIQLGTPFRFGLSFDVRQAGKLLGGFRAGATCRRVQQRGFSVVRCQATGVAQHA
jgi:hypothetical protein